MKQSQPESLLVFLAAILIATPIVISFDIVAKRILWPLLKWATKRTWSKLASTSKPAEKALVPAAAPSLPTPDIFKGAPNLAPMRPFRF